MYLFVCGTLKRGAHPMAEELWRDAEFMGEATVEGALYNLGQYPGLLLEKGSLVHGEVARLLNTDATLTRLDEYEGSDFRRVSTVATLESGSELEVMLYSYTGPLGAAPRIESGRWQ